MEQPLLNNATPTAGEVKQSFSFPQQSSRWVLSVLCVVFFIVSLRLYEAEGNLSPPQVSTFYIITTLLSLLLALGFFVSSRISICYSSGPKLGLIWWQDAFKDLAKASRWRILGMGGWSESEKTLIRKTAQWTAVVELALHELVLRSRAKSWVIFACIFWVSVPQVCRFHNSIWLYMTLCRL